MSNCGVNQFWKWLVLCIPCVTLKNLVFVLMLVCITKQNPTFSPVRACSSTYPGSQIAYRNRIACILHQDRKNMINSSFYEISPKMQALTRMKCLSWWHNSHFHHSIIAGFYKANSDQGNTVIWSSYQNFQRRDHDKVAKQTAWQFMYSLLTYYLYMIYECFFVLLAYY